MLWVAMRMLIGDAQRYLALVLGVAFATVLMAHQMSVFWGVMLRTTSLIRDVHPTGIWVMDANVLYVDEPRPLRDGDLSRVRGVPEIDWAVPLAQGHVLAHTRAGRHRQCLLVGLDDATLTGAPTLLAGELTSLRDPNAVLLDDAGYSYLWPGEARTLPRWLEVNDRRAVVAGVCKVTPPFQTMPVLYAPYGRAVRYLPPGRRCLSYILASPRPCVPDDEACAAVRAATGLDALSGPDFSRRTVVYYFLNTGIPLNFMVVVSVAFVVGVAVVGQTFYLFTRDNLRQFGTLKAMGVSNARVVGMALTQAAWVGAVGYAVGIGGAALLIDVSTFGSKHLEGFFLPWQVMAAVAVAVAAIMTLTCLFSVRGVLRLEPAAVFRA